jgi:DNA anti-recombination protein RmuC
MNKDPFGKTFGGAMKVALHDDQVRESLAENAEINTRENVPSALEAMVANVNENRRVLDEGLRYIESAQKEFAAGAKGFLGDIRATRMASVSEMNQILQPLRDIRKFFLGPEHEVEITRLREFIDLCERLEGLKTRGTLDALADTILKLVP